MYAILLLGIAACTGASTDTETSPSDTEDLYARTQLSDGGGWWATWTSDPTPVPPNELFSVTVELEATGEGEAITAVSIDAGMPEHGHGMNVTPEVTEQEDGSWLASPMKFHMTGDWTLMADVTTASGSERVTWLLDCCEVR